MSKRIGVTRARRLIRRGCGKLPKMVRQGVVDAVSWAYVIVHRAPLVHIPRTSKYLSKYRITNSYVVQNFETKKHPGSKLSAIQILRFKEWWITVMNAGFLAAAAHG